MKREEVRSLHWYREEMMAAGNNAHRLAELMTMMEKQFSIPFVKSKEWEAGNVDVITLYKQLSARRDMED